MTNAQSAETSAQKRVAIVPKTLLFETTRAAYSLTSAELDILLLSDGRRSAVLEVGIGALVAGALGLAGVTLKWMNARQDTWWLIAQDHVWICALAGMLASGSWLTSRRTDDPRATLISRLRTYFDANR